MTPDPTPLGLDDVRVWLWLASVWGGGWLWSKAPFLQPYIFYDAFGDLSDGDHRALILVLSIINAGFVYGALGTLPREVFDVPFFWGGPISLALGGVVCALVHVIAQTGSGKNPHGMHSKYLAKKNAIFDLVKKADEQKILAMLTLSNRKVYIGLPLHVSDWKNPDPSAQHLYFLPLWSGHRKQDSLEMKITTDYAGAYLRIRDRFKITAAEMVVPAHQIIHAQPFDEDFYEEIQRASPAPKRKPARKK